MRRQLFFDPLLHIPVPQEDAAAISEGLQRLENLQQQHSTNTTLDYWQQIGQIATHLGEIAQRQCAQLEQEQHRMNNTLRR